MWVFDSDSFIWKLQWCGSSSRPAVRGPLRFNLHWADIGPDVVPKATPFPIFGICSQSALHRIAMNVAQLLDETLVAAHVVVVVALLPEGCVVSLLIMQFPGAQPKSSAIELLLQEPQLRFPKVASARAPASRHNHILESRRCAVSVLNFRQSCREPGRPADVADAGNN